MKSGHSVPIRAVVSSLLGRATLGDFKVWSAFGTPEMQLLVVVCARDLFSARVSAHTILYFIPRAEQVCKPKLAMGLL